MTLVQRPQSFEALSARFADHLLDLESQQARQAAIDLLRRSQEVDALRNRILFQAAVKIVLPLLISTACNIAASQAHKMSQAKIAKQPDFCFRGDLREGCTRFSAIRQKWLFRTGSDVDGKCAKLGTIFRPWCALSQAARRFQNIGPGVSQAKARQSLAGLLQAWGSGADTMGQATEGIIEADKQRHQGTMDSSKISRDDSSNSEQRFSAAFDRMMQKIEDDRRSSTNAVDAIIRCF